MSKRDRYPKIPEKGCCRGCGQPVGKGRQTWCSDKCYKEKCPALVLRRVYHRDKGVCAICAADTHSLRTAYLEAVRQIKVDYFQFNHDYKAYNEAKAEALAAIRPAGFPPHLHWSEIDHIIPFSEGGETIESNLRTLCYPCHKKRTAEWRKSRSQAAQKEKEPSLI